MQVNSLRLPDFLVIGAARGGTTSIFHYLRQHPDLFLPENKEPFFFSFMDREPIHLGDDEFRRHVVWRLDDYTALFRKAEPRQLCGEGSTSYLYTYRAAIENIQRLYGKNTQDLKLVAVLRNPVERAFSHYMYFIRRRKEDLPFHEAIQPETIRRRKKLNPAYDYVGYGCYYSQVLAYKEAFPHLKIFLFEDLRARDKFMKELFEFLAVPADVSINLDFTTNPSGFPRNRFSRFILDIFSNDSALKRLINRRIPAETGLKQKVLGRLINKEKIPEEQAVALTEYFREDIFKLEKLLERDLSHWYNKTVPDG